MPKGSVPPLPCRKFLTQLALTQAFAIGLSPFLPLTAVAQPVVPTPTPTPTTTPGGAAGTTTPSVTLPTDRSNIILPTDVLPLTAAQEKIPFGENLQLRLNQILPARFYFSSSCETSLRLETNPFQFPTKRALLRQLPTGQQFLGLSASNQELVRKIIRQADSQDMVFRVLPNVTAGWTVTPRTRAFFNYFMIRDQLAKNVVLNTMIHSYAFGLQQDFPIASRANLQAEIQFRELNQWHQQSVFDFLPGLTLSYIANPKTVLFANALLQMRGKKYFQGPTKELDPFYTFGALHSRGGWTFAVSTTIVQNFREPFRGNATIPVNNYAIISDFEIARRLMKQIPGFQAFVRAEPIFNFHSHNRPGLAGTDFRLFGGFRLAVAKPALTATINNIMEQLRNQENETPGPQTGPKPSAFLPATVMADVHSPIHGPFGSGDAEGVGAAEAVMPPKIAEADAGADAETKAGAEEKPVVADAGGGSGVVAARAPDIASMDWRSVLAEVPPDVVPVDPGQTHELVELLSRAAAESTVVAYEETQKRADAIALRGKTRIETKPVVPQVEVARADWDAVVPEVAAATKDTGLRESGVLNTELAAAATTVEDAGLTSVRVAKLAPEVKLMIAAKPLVIPQAPVAVSKPANISMKLWAPSPMVVAAAKQPVAPLVIPPAPVAVAKPAVIAMKLSAPPPAHVIAVKPVVKPIVVAEAPVAVSKPVSIAMRLSATLPKDVVALKPVVIPQAPVAMSQPSVIAMKLSASAPKEVVAVKPVVIPPAPVALSKPSAIAMKLSASAPKEVVAAKPIVIPQAPVALSKPSVIAMKLSTTLPKDVVAAKPIVIPQAPVALSKPSVIAMKLSTTLPKDVVATKPIVIPQAPVALSKPSVIAMKLSTTLPKDVVATKPIVIPQAPVALSKPSVIAMKLSAVVPTDVAAVKPMVAVKPIVVPQAPVALSKRAMIALHLPVVAPDVEREVEVDLKRAGNWDNLAEFGMKRVGQPQSISDLHDAVVAASYESAKVLDYSVLNNSRRTQIAAKPPITKQAQPLPPGAAHPVMMVPINVDLTPSSITSERPATENGSVAIERVPRNNQSKPDKWDHHTPTRAHDAMVDMHIVPPLPTVRVSDKRDPFKGTGIDIHKSIMLSVPH